MVSQGLVLLFKFIRLMFTYWYITLFLVLCSWVLMGICIYGLCDAHFRMKYEHERKNT